jgi:GxxExxY protein
MHIKNAPLLSESEEEIVTQTIESGLTVHRELGPGFRERRCEPGFCLEVDCCGMRFECEKPIEVRYKDWRIPGQRIDLIVEGVVLVVIKAVPQQRQLHGITGRVLLEATGLRVGLLMNVNASRLKDGLRRVVL